LNKKGETVIDFLYDDAEVFNKGVAVVCVDDNYYLIDKEGKPINDQNMNFWRRISKAV
jgi:hypothetical protein